MKKISKFIIVSGSVADVEIHINDCLKTGWELKGELVVYAGRLCQAMVKYEQENY